VNVFATFKSLFPAPPLQVGTVTAINGGVATLSLVGGFSATARGTTTVGAKVFFRNGVIEGAAPNLTLDVIQL
jgi:hypothetical protein